MPKQEVFILRTTIIESGNERKIVDQDTGEILYNQEKREFWCQDDEFVQIVKPGSKKKMRKKPDFIKVYRVNIQDIIRKKKLNLTEAGVFMMLLSFVDWESNFLVHPDTNKLLNISDLARLIGQDRTSLSRQIKKLNDKGLLSLVYNGNGRANKIILNSNIVFSGTKMKDIREHELFDDCPYKPKYRVEYEQSKKKVKRL